MAMSGHPTTDLAGYAAGTLSEEAQRAVREHLAACDVCGRRFALWRSVGAALRQDGPPPQDAVAAMLRHAVHDPEPVVPRAGLARHARFAGQLLLAQLRLVRVSVWLASVVVMGLGVVLAMMGTHHDWSEAVLAMVAPIVAAAGIAGVCGTERDAGFEFLSATVTSPRVVLVARVALVFGYDFVLALVSSVVLAGFGVDSSGLTALVSAWLGPMVVLSAFCLLLSVTVGTTVAATVALAVWVTRLLAPSLAMGTEWLVPVARAVEALWSTNMLTGPLAAVLLCAAVVFAGRPLAVR